ncbi:hypothetical protein GOP47_0025984 [Adiantum capillus-veneris]|uniref:Uncharacterized protein n=1 Tax=Adiantum capillus-veneris TaxID=13818 RepID=A0A9D4Z3C6_ADICA|nr:hypothetical protein GOP47_0025984 [Adiantum capillus-veneris]
MIQRLLAPEFRMISVIFSLPLLEPLSVRSKFSFLPLNLWLVMLSFSSLLLNQWLGMLSFSYMFMGIELFQFINVDELEEHDNLEYGEEDHEIEYGEEGDIKIEPF